jgi:hypothetical protein
VQVPAGVPENDPGLDPLAVNVTVPVGAPGVPLSVSVTVAVQVIATPIVGVPGHVTVVEAERLPTLSVAEPAPVLALPVCVASPP